MNIHAGAVVRFEFDKAACGVSTGSIPKGVLKIDSTEATTASTPCSNCGQDVNPDLDQCGNCENPISRKLKVPSWHIHRHIYNWTLAWAYKPSASVALFVLSFAESSFFPIPPDVLLMPLVLGNRKRWLRYATLCTVGSVAGAFLGYLIGAAFITLALKIPGITEPRIEALANEFNIRGQWYVFIAALTPIPFKLLTITAGFAKMNLLVFAAACLVGRSMRFFAVAALLRLFGAKITPFIDKYFNWLSLGFAVLLVGGFVALKYFH